MNAHDTMTKKGKNVTRSGLGALALALLALGGCAQLDAMAPKAFEKEILAKKEMTIEGDAHEGRLTQRIYSSRENASGGYGVGGGGCGCN
jgi:hypothetical protein